MGMDILTMTMVKHYSIYLNGIVMDIMVENVKITEYPSLSGRLAFFTP